MVSPQVLVGVSVAVLVICLVLLIRTLAGPSPQKRKAKVQRRAERVAARAARKGKRPKSKRRTAREERARRLVAEAKAKQQAAADAKRPSRGGRTAPAVLPPTNAAAGPGGYARRNDPTPHQLATGDLTRVGEGLIPEHAAGFDTDGPDDDELLGTTHGFEPSERAAPTTTNNPFVPDPAPEPGPGDDHPGPDEPPSRGRRAQRRRWWRTPAGREGRPRKGPGSNNEILGWSVIRPNR